MSANRVFSCRLSVTTLDAIKATAKGLSLTQREFIELAVARFASLPEVKRAAVAIKEAKGAMADAE